MYHRGRLRAYLYGVEVFPFEKGKGFLLLEYSKVLDTPGGARAL